MIASFAVTKRFLTHPMSYTTGEAPIYDKQEIEQLRSLISRLRFLDEAESQQTNTAIAEGRCPTHLAPFWPFFTEEVFAD